MKTKIKLLLVMLIFSTAVMADNYIPDGKIIKVPRDFPTIQAAINAAGPSDMVLVSEGTYYENIRFNGKSITVASRYIIDHKASHITKTIIHGLTHPNSPEAATVMFVDGEDTTSVLIGFTITGGHGVLNETFQRRCGGGIYALNSGPKIINNIITGNTVEGVKASGAGICCLMDDKGDYWTVIESNIIRYNSSLSNGHLACGGGISVSINSKIKNNLIEFNTCTNTDGQAYGGGIELEELAGTSIASFLDNNLIMNNIAEGAWVVSGAGINVTRASSVIINNVIASNEAISDHNARGGGIFIDESTDGVELIDNRLLYNYCSGTYAHGAGLMIRQTGKTELVGNRFYGNTTIADESSAGAGVWITQATDSIVAVKNTFQENQAGFMSFGGAIGIYSATCGIVCLDRNVISDNTAREGAGLWVYNTYDIHLCNNVFLRNTASYLGGAIKYNKYTGGNKDYSFSGEGTIENNNSKDFLRPVISNNNFVQNTAFKGGAICSDMGGNTPVIFNSIFCNNSAFVADDLKTLSDDPFAVYNCLINTEELNTHWTGANNIFCDPLLEGDCTHLCWGSNCANAGEDALFYDHVWYHCVTYDIDGEQRPYAGTQPDIGVDETEVVFQEMPGDDEREEIINVFPAPVRSKATVAFELAENTHVVINIYSANGALAKTVYSSTLPEGIHRVAWNAGNLSPGVYFLKADLGKQSYTKKIVIVK